MKFYLSQSYAYPAFGLRPNDRFEELLERYYEGANNLDQSFYSDLKPLIKVIAKLSEEDRQKLIPLISDMINAYLSVKVEDQLNKSLQQILK